MLPSSHYSNQLKRMTDIIPKVIETIKKLANNEAKENYILFNYPKKDDCKVSTQGDIYSVILKLDSDLQKHITSYVNRYHDGANEQKYIISCISYILDTFIAQYSIVKVNDLSYFPTTNPSTVKESIKETNNSDYLERFEHLYQKRCGYVYLDGPQKGDRCENDRLMVSECCEIHKSKGHCKSCDTILINPCSHEGDIYCEDCFNEIILDSRKETCCRRCGTYYLPDGLIEYKEKCYCEDCYGYVIRKEGRGNSSSKVESKKKETRCGNCDNLIEGEKGFYCSKYCRDATRKEGENKKIKDSKEDKEKKTNRCKFVFRDGICGGILGKGPDYGICKKCGKCEGISSTSPN